MAKKTKPEQNYDDGSYVVKKDKRLIKVLSFLVCLLIAFVIWVYVTGVEDENSKETQEPAVTQNGAVSESVDSLKNG